MNRTLILGIAIFFAVVGIALLGGEKTAVARLVGALLAQRRIECSSMDRACSTNANRRRSCATRRGAAPPRLRAISPPAPIRDANARHAGNRACYRRPN